MARSGPPLRAEAPAIIFPGLPETLARPCALLQQGLQAISSFLELSRRTQAPGAGEDRAAWEARLPRIRQARDHLQSQMPRVVGGIRRIHQLLTQEARRLCGCCDFFRLDLRRGPWVPLGDRRRAILDSADPAWCQEALGAEGPMASAPEVEQASCIAAHFARAVPPRWGVACAYARGRRTAICPSCTNDERLLDQAFQVMQESPRQPLFRRHGPRGEAVGRELVGAAAALACTSLLLGIPLCEGPLLVDQAYRLAASSLAAPGDPGAPAQALRALRGLLPEAGPSLVRRSVLEAVALELRRRLPCAGQGDPGLGGYRLLMRAVSLVAFLARGSADPLGLSHLSGRCPPGCPWDPARAAPVADVASLAPPAVRAAVFVRQLAPAVEEVVRAFLKYRRLQHRCCGKRRRHGRWG